MHVSIRACAAIFICKLLRLVSRILHRGGTAMPGRIAVKICPDLLSTLSRNITTIAVTGTNGKTTTCRMIEEIFHSSGLDYFSNRSGANLMSGIVTEFAMHASIWGKIQKQYAVIECDEGAARTVFGKLQPTAIVVTNIFRDQLDRYGEITHTLASIREGILSCPNALLCLNADCSLTSSLASDTLPNPVIWYGIDSSASISDAPSTLSDASYCIRCKHEYLYDYHTYAHLGGFRCPNCGYQRHDADYSIRSILNMDENSSNVRFHGPWGESDISVNLPAVYNLYNAAAAICGCVSSGLQPEICLESVGHFSCGFGRMEHFQLGESGTCMILVKNPAGCSQALHYLTNTNSPFILTACLNDRAADGTDVSWIWDADFESLAPIAEKIEKIYVSGDRGADMRIRLKYAGLPDKSVSLIESPDELASALQREVLPVYILPTYTAMVELRSAIIRLCGGSEFWE